MRGGFLKCLVLRRMHIWLFSSHLRKGLCRRSNRCDSSGGGNEFTTVHGCSSSKLKSCWRRPKRRKSDAHADLSYKERGGKGKLGFITKQGNRYLRRLLVLGATSLLRVVGRRKGALRDWLVALLARKPARLVTVALANKLARIIWAVMTTGETFRMEIFARA
jgi:hypothetical protein